MTKFKKLMMVVLIGITLFSLTACTDGKDSSLNSNTPENNKVEENTSDVNQDIKPGVNYGDGWLVGYDIYLDARTNRRCKGVGDATIFYGNGMSMVSVKPVTEEFSGTYKDILPVLNTGKNLDDIDNGLLVSFDDDKEFFFIVESESDVEIKGMQCRKITGSVIDKEGKKLLGYGYTFIFDNIPFMMMGYVFDESDDAVKQELIDEVEVMINSLRKD